MVNEDDLKRLKEKDPEFLKALVDQYTDYLYYLSYKKGFLDEEAEELVQNVWTRFFSSLETFEGRSSIKTYLLGIFFNVYKEEVRSLVKDKKKDSIDEIFESQFDSTGHWQLSGRKGPDGELWVKQVAKHLEDCVSALDDKYRDAFLLKEVAEEKTENICNILQLQRTHLGVLLFRARAHLKQCLEGRIR